MVDPEPYTTPEDLRLWYPKPLAEDRIEDEVLSSLVAEFEELAERYRGVAYQPRERTVTTELGRMVVDCRYTGRILVPDPMVTEISEAIVGGTTLETEELELLTYHSDIRAISGFAALHATSVVTYTHGFEAPPPAVLRACREFVRAKALEAIGNGPRNAISYSDDSGYSYRDSTADWAAGRPTGLRTVDDALNSVDDYRYVGVARKPRNRAAVKRRLAQIAAHVLEHKDVEVSYTWDFSAVSNNTFFLGLTTGDEVPTSIGKQAEDAFTIDATLYMTGFLDGETAEAEVEETFTLLDDVIRADRSRLTLIPDLEPGDAESYAGLRSCRIGLVDGPQHSFPSTEMGNPITGFVVFAFNCVTDLT